MGNVMLPLLLLSHILLKGLLIGEEKLLRKQDLLELFARQWTDSPENTRESQYFAFHAHRPRESQNVKPPTLVEYHEALHQ
jgi:hypothetical protein